MVDTFFCDFISFSIPCIFFVIHVVSDLHVHVFYDLNFVSYDLDIA